MQRIRELVRREPWLGVSLSWLFPGLAHRVSGASVFGVVLIGVYVLVRAINVAAVISATIPVVWMTALGSCSLPLVAGYAAWDAFRRGKTHGAGNYNAARSSRKDPYLAVFLTLLVPGLGHAYLRKWLSSVAVLVGWLVASLLLEMVGWVNIGPLLLRLLIVGHTCAVCVPPTGQQKRHFIALTVLLIGVCFLTQYLQLLAVGHYFGTIESFVGPSMAPTVSDDAYGVLDKFTYRYREPAVGEIIKFRHPPTSFDKEHETAGKRIVAVGGETVQVRGGLVYVEGQLRESGPGG